MSSTEPNTSEADSSQSTPIALGARPQPKEYVRPRPLDATMVVIERASSGNGPADSSDAARRYAEDRGLPLIDLCERIGQMSGLDRAELMGDIDTLSSLESAALRAIRGSNVDVVIGVDSDRWSTVSAIASQLGIEKVEQ